MIVYGEESQDKTTLAGPTHQERAESHLPECVQIAVCGSRAVTLHDREPCGIQDALERYAVYAAHVADYGPIDRGPYKGHPGIWPRRNLDEEPFVNVRTDSKDVALHAFERGEAWIRKEPR